MLSRNFTNSKVALWIFSCHRYRCHMFSYLCILFLRKKLTLNSRIYIFFHSYNGLIAKPIGVFYRHIKHNIKRKSSSRGEGKTVFSFLSWVNQCSWDFTWKKHAMSHSVWPGVAHSVQSNIYIYVCFSWNVRRCPCHVRNIFFVMCVCTQCSRFENMSWCHMFSFRVLCTC